MSAGGAFGGARGVSTKAPEKGVFPLDHFGECTTEKKEYMKCLAEHKQQAEKCTELAKVYLTCRMDKNLMAKQSLQELGLEGLHKTDDIVAASDTSRSQEGFVAGVRRLRLHLPGVVEYDTATQVTDTVAQCDLAVKIMTRSRLSPLQEHQVLRGCRVHAACAAIPHVLPLYAVLQDESQLYVFTAPGLRGDLAQFVAARGRTLTPSQVVKFVVRPLVSALVQLHALGRIHRDIKPENMLVAADGTILLSDFDLSIDSTTDAPTSRVGTPDYIAPEVLRPTVRSDDACSPTRNGTHVYDCKVDVWAVGVLIWELLEGRAPFAARSTAAVKERVLAGGEQMPQWSTSCQDFVRRCMDRDVGKRATAEQLLGHEWLQSVGTC